MTQRDALDIIVFEITVWDCETVPPWLRRGPVPSWAAMVACPAFKNPAGTDQTAVVAAQAVR